MKLLDGKKLTYNLRDFESVIWNAEPKKSELRVGALVISGDESRETGRRMTLGRVREIRTAPKKRTRFLVDFYDGKSVLVTLDKLRVVPQMRSSGMLVYCYIYRVSQKRYTKLINCNLKLVTSINNM